MVVDSAEGEEGDFVLSISLEHDNVPAHVGANLMCDTTVLLGADLFWPFSVPQTGTYTFSATGFDGLFGMGIRAFPVDEVGLLTRQGQQSTNGTLELHLQAGDLWYVLMSDTVEMQYTCGDPQAQWMP